MRRLLRKRLDVDSERTNEPIGDGTIGFWTLNQLRATVEQLRVAAELKFIALGVTPEIVVIVEQQNAHTGRGPGPEELRSRQTADSSTHHHQVVRLAGIDTARRP